MSTPNTSLVKWVSDRNLFDEKDKVANYSCLFSVVPVIPLANLTELVKGLEMALNHQIANRGTADAFYTCYTYPHGQMPEWVARAEKALTQIEGAQGGRLDG